MLVLGRPLVLVSNLRRPLSLVVLLSLPLIDGRRHCVPPETLLHLRLLAFARLYGTYEAGLQLRVVAARADTH
jgi:hypothetical protein